MKSFSVTIAGNLRKNTYAGTFIALEGIDGSGKSSQVEPLKHFFTAQGKTVLATNWPRRDEGLVAEITKSYLKGSKKFPRQAFQYLLSADYVMYSEEVIIPALKRGDIVITDRCHIWSAVAYGLWDNDETYDLSTAESILVAHGVMTKAYQFILPDITYYLDVSVLTAMGRLSQEKQKEIYEKADVLQKITEGYIWLTQKFPEAFIVIDAEQPLSKVSETLLASLR